MEPTKKELRMAKKAVLREKIAQFKANKEAKKAAFDAEVLAKIDELRNQNN